MVENARFCKQCGTALAGAPIRPNLSWRPLVAAALSIVPGLGQLYKGKRWHALGWFIGVTVAYHFVWPFGFILHLVCAGNAALAGSIHEQTALSRLDGNG